MSRPQTETIVAIATAPGAGGVGIVRLSGPQALSIAAHISDSVLQPRRVHYVGFRDTYGQLLDDGIALAFSAPHSFTGEDVAELQAHGSPVVLRQLVALACQLGARRARAGEFSERAFLNGKLDLAQAEAIADLIAAGDERAARAARRAMDGVFSTRVHALAEQLLMLRVHVEAAIDFADESLDTLGGAAVQHGLELAQVSLTALMADAERGRRLRDGLHVVIVGPPNAGKSSLLNALVGSERAIVTDVAGTTRDVLRESVHLAGLELTLVDTAGLREGGDAIEREGMRRAHVELQRADIALVVLDATAPESGRAAVIEAIAEVPKRLWVHNKADLLGGLETADTDDTVHVSAMHGQGLQTLQNTLHALAGIGAPECHEGEFTARERHVVALQKTGVHLQQTHTCLKSEQLELAAEELKLAHDALGEITGTVSVDTLLGHIFSTFCIGK